MKRLVIALALVSSPAFAGFRFESRFLNRNAELSHEFGAGYAFERNIVGLTIASKQENVGFTVGANVAHYKTLMVEKLDVYLRGGVNYFTETKKYGILLEPGLRYQAPNKTGLYAGFQLSDNNMISPVVGVDLTFLE